jgi:hypothetical protein
MSTPKNLDDKKPRPDNGARFYSDIVTDNQRPLLATIK